MRYSQATKMPRCRPFHTCACSCIAIAHNACKKIQDLDGPVGPKAQQAFTFLNSSFPFVHTMLSHFLVMLTTIDDHILTLETKIEAIVPRSTYVFDKIDTLICATEALPHKLGHIILTKLPSMIPNSPIFDWVLVQLISSLNLLVSVLTHLRSKDTREKEIRMDVSGKTEEDGLINETKTTKALPKGVVHLSVKRFHSWKSRMKALEEPLYAGDSPMYSSYHSANTSPVSDTSPDGTHMLNNNAGKADNMSWTYKEMLERGTKEEEERVEED